MEQPRLEVSAATLIPPAPNSAPRRDQLAYQQETTKYLNIINLFGYKIMSILDRNHS